MHCNGNQRLYHHRPGINLLVASLTLKTVVVVAAGAGNSVAAEAGTAVVEVEAGTVARAVAAIR